ncbi:MAG: FAD-dependent oxidoreductase [Bacillota bacterium]
MENLYDVIVVGGGPAGLSAAIYAARARYNVLVIEQKEIGGQINIAPEVVNYPAIGRTTGRELTKSMHEQAESFGANFQIATVTTIQYEENIKTVVTDKGDFQTLGIILALGAKPRKIGFPRESEFQGRGVAYCATCDGEFFEGNDIYVIGDGLPAVEEGLFLTKYGKHVHIIVKRNKFTCPEAEAEAVLNNEKVTVHFETAVEGIEGDSVVQSITLKDIKTDEVRTIKPENGLGVFVFAGHAPTTSWVPAAIGLQDGYLLTNEYGETKVKGIYAAGDVRIKELRQVVTAVSDGAVAATSLMKHVSEMRKELNLPAYKGGVKKPEASKKEVATTPEVKPTEVDDDAFIDGAMRQQLVPIFEKFENKVIVSAVLDDSDLGKEMVLFLDEVKTLSEKIDVKIEKAKAGELAPFMEFLYHDGTSSGVRYLAMPGGHEFNSFITALYNVSAFKKEGAGKAIAPEEEKRIANLTKEIDVKVLLTLTCTMCPETVISTQKIASFNDKIQASAIDIGHFPDIRKKYNVMSVPCMVINDEIVHFGKKNLSEVLDILETI